MQNGIKKHIERRKKKEYLINEIKFTLKLGSAIIIPLIGAVAYWIEWGYAL